MMESFERGARSRAWRCDGSGIDRGPAAALPARALPTGQYEPGAADPAGQHAIAAAGQPGLPRADAAARAGAAERLLLVDRGWVPLGATRQQLPAVTVEARSAHASPAASTSFRYPACVSATRRRAGETGWPRVLNFPSAGRRRDARSDKRSSRGSCCSMRPAPTATSAAGGRRSAFRRSATSATRSSGSRWR